MERIEILTGYFVASQFGGPAAITDRGSFVGNNAVTEVETDTAAVLFRFVLVNPAGLYWVTPRDNVVFLSAWLTMPYHYVLSRPDAVVSIVYGDTAASGGIPEIGSGNGTLYVPVSGAEISLGSIVPWRSIGAGTQMCFGFSVHCWVSQVGAAAALNGTRFRPGLAVKVLHTEPLT